MPEKFREKYRKNQHTGSFQKSPGGARGGPRGGQAATRRGPTPGPPLAAPFRLFIPRHGKTPKEDPYSAKSPLFRRRRVSKIGSTKRPLPGTLPEGGLPSGSLLSTMDAPRMSC